MHTFPHAQTLSFLPLQTPDAVRAFCSMHASLRQAAFVTLTAALIATDFLVLFLLLVHERLQFRVVVLGDGLGCHLDGQSAVLAANRGLNLFDGLLEHLDTVALVDGCAGQDVEWWRDESDLDLSVLGALRLGHTQRALYGVDALISEASNL